MHEHLVFFDADCPLCHRAVKRILEIDVKKHFLFSPLHGESARDILIGPQKELIHSNGLILVENYTSTEREFWVKLQALYRAHWLVEDGWELTGLLSFIPSLISDPIYDQFSAHRHQFKMKLPQEIPQDRILE